MGYQTIVGPPESAWLLLRKMKLLYRMLPICNSYPFVNWAGQMASLFALLAIRWLGGLYLHYLQNGHLQYGLS